jgi:hypothetical protein
MAGKMRAAARARRMMMIDGARMNAKKVRANDGFGLDKAHIEKQKILCAFV